MASPKPSSLSIPAPPTNILPSPPSPQLVGASAALPASLPLPIHPQPAVRPAIVASSSRSEQPVPFPVPPAAPLPSRVYSDASSCKPYWRVAIAAWRQSDPTRADHCDRILDCIENGLPIDPNPLPKNKHLPNTPVIRQHAEAVRTQLQSYQASGAIEQCKRADIIAVHPIHAIVRPARKLRVVVDFSLNLNKSMTVIPMQQSSSVDSAVRLSRLGCYYSKLDIRDCFHSFSVRAGSERLLGFYFEGRYYRFRRLQFGLNTAPELCELMLSVVSWKLNQLGVKHVRYCDDILVIGSTAVTCSNMTDTAIHELDLFGFAVSHAKTIRCVQVIDFLGIQLNSIDGTLSCPPHRVAELLELLAIAAVHGTTHVVRFILSLIGKLSFAAQVLPGARPFFRSLIDATRGKNRREFVQLSPDTLTDIRYWLDHLSTWNGRQLWRSSARPIVIATDASLLGWGGLVLYCPPSTTLPPQLAVGSATAGRWCHSHPIRSSSDIGWAELYAVLFLVAAVGAAAPNSSITLLVDNQADVHIINRQSTRSPALLSLLRAIYSVATTHNLRITARHIPGTSNAAADALSRSLPLPYQLSPVSRFCSCEAPPVTVSWCHPSSRYSNAYRCGSPPAPSTASSMITTAGSAKTLVGTQQVRYPKPVSARLPFTSVASGPLSRFPTTSPLSTIGTKRANSVSYQKVDSGNESTRGSIISTVSSITQNPHSHSHSLTSTSSFLTSTSVPLIMPAIGAPHSSPSLDYFVSESIALPLHLLSSSASDT